MSADFYLKRVYSCPCLTYTVNQICDDGLREYTEISNTILIYKLSQVFAFSTRVENKRSCFVMCDLHILLILHAEASYDCTSETNDDFLFEGLNKRYCKDCVKHYLRKVYDIFPFTAFNK